MKWSLNAWKQSEAIYEQIINMPFNKELMKGTLSLDRFKFYMAQDAIYLGHFSKALALIGARSLNLQHTLDFTRFAENAVVVERVLHEGYFKKFGVDTEAIISPTCQNYTQFLLTKAALDQVEVAMAAVLPCFWIYKKVGDHIFQHKQNNNNPYQEWINTYAGEEFGTAVQKAIDICDEVAVTCTPHQQERMIEAFIMASKLEWMFWDSAWRLEQWPI